MIPTFNIYMNRFNKLLFNETTHKYTNGVTDLISVTSLLSKYQVPFDYDKFLTLSAKKHGITEEELAAQWKNTNYESIKKGNRVHNYLEKAVHGTYRNTKFKELKSCNDFIAWYKANNYIPVASEFLIHNNYIAGKPDHLAYHEEEGWVLFDYKTNTNLYKKHYNNFLPPISHLPDNKINLYSLQLNMYENLLGIECKKKIVYIKENQFDIIDIHDLKKEIKDLYDDWTNNRSDTRTT